MVSLAPSSFTKGIDAPICVLAIFSSVELVASILPVLAGPISYPGRAVTLPVILWFVVPKVSLVAVVAVPPCIVITLPD